MPFRSPTISRRSLAAARGHILSPAKIVARVKRSRVPDTGWTDRAFRTYNGRALVRDMVIAQRASIGKGIRTLAPKLQAWFDSYIEEVIRVVLARASVSYGVRAVGSKAEVIALAPGAHEALWGEAIEEVLRERNLSFVSANLGAVQSVVDSSHATTISLLGLPGTTRGARSQLQGRVRDIASRVTNINETTRGRMRSIISTGIANDLTVPQMAGNLREKFKGMSGWRTALIARTEMGQAADAGRNQGIKDSGVVTHVSVIGCITRETTGRYTMDGESTCNIHDVPVARIDELVFHPGHTGTTIPSRFRDPAEDERQAPLFLNDGDTIEPSSGPRGFVLPPTVADDAVDPFQGLRMDGDAPEAVTGFDRTMQDKRFTMPARAANAPEASMVWVSVDEFDDAFRADNDMYIGAGGAGGIEGRYDRFGTYFADNVDIEVSELSILKEDTGTGTVRFINGRHRYAYMRDSGATHIPVALYSDAGTLSAVEARRLGLVYDPDLG